MSDLAATAFEQARDANLPANYESAKQALAELQRVDECKNWSDKAMALASYARQAKDDALLKMSQRIQGRAVRRAGQLLQELERPEHCGRPKKNGQGALTIKGAAEKAGLSRYQRNTALKVLPGFEHVQERYVVTRDDEDVFIHTYRLSWEEFTTLGNGLIKKGMAEVSHGKELLGLRDVVHPDRLAE